MVDIYVEILATSLPVLKEKLRFKVKTWWTRVDVEDGKTHVHMPPLEMSQDAYELAGKKTSVFLEVWYKEDEGDTTTSNVPPSILDPYDNNDADGSGTLRFLGLVSQSVNHQLANPSSNPTLEWLPVEDPIQNLKQGRVLLSIDAKFVPLSSTLRSTAGRQSNSHRHEVLPSPLSSYFRNMDVANVSSPLSNAVEFDDGAEERTKGMTDARRRQSNGGGGLASAKDLVVSLQNHNRHGDSLRWGPIPPSPDVSVIDGGTDEEEDRMVISDSDVHTKTRSEFTNTQTEDKNWTPTPSSISHTQSPMFSLASTKARVAVIRRHEQEEAERSRMTNGQVEDDIELNNMIAFLNEPKTTGVSNPPCCDHRKLDENIQTLEGIQSDLKRMSSTYSPRGRSGKEGVKTIPHHAQKQKEVNNGGILKKPPEHPPHPPTPITKSKVIPDLTVVGRGLSPKLPHAQPDKLHSKPPIPPPTLQSTTISSAGRDRGNQQEFRRGATPNVQSSTIMPPPYLQSTTISSADRERGKPEEFRREGRPSMPPPTLESTTISSAGRDEEFRRLIAARNLQQSTIMPPPRLQSTTISSAGRKEREKPEEFRREDRTNMMMEEHSRLHFPISQKCAAKFSCT